VLALVSPTVTYHLLPPVAAAAWPVTGRLVSSRLTRPAALSAAVAGFRPVAATTAALDRAAALSGPALVGGSAAHEALLFAAGGAIWGSWAAIRAHPGLVLRAFGAGRRHEPVR
jgi:hypothetical protein